MPGDSVRHLQTKYNYKVTLSDFFQWTNSYIVEKLLLRKNCIEGWGTGCSTVQLFNCSTVSLLKLFYYFPPTWFDTIYLAGAATNHSP